jgi:diguanylate cyclase (GGDEF)-like protein/PAS domain S-box-containing protein
MANGVQLEIGFGLGKGDDAFASGFEAATQALTGIQVTSPSLVTVFASVCYELEELLQGVHAAVGDVPIVGATTAGEICNGPQHESVVVTILASPYLEVKVGLGEKVSEGWRQAVAQVVNAPGLAPFFSADDSAAWSDLTCQGKSAFALLFAPGETSTKYIRSFEILEELKRLSQGRLPIIGGCAGDDLRMETNYVLWGQRAYPNSVLLVFCQTNLRFGIAMAHGFHATDRRAMVTRASDHEVIELDGQMAAKVYSRLQGRSRESLKGQHLTLVTGQPLGILDPCGQYSVNAVAFFTPNDGLQVAQPVSEGTILTVMAATPESMLAAGREALRKALLRGSITRAAIVLVFSCALRASFLGERLVEETRGMQEILPEVPITGFYSMGEQGLADDGVNRNNTEVITVLVLSGELSYAAQVALENKRLRIEAAQAEALKIAYGALAKEVSERQKAEQARVDSERFQANIVDSIQDGLSILDDDLNITRVNPTMERWYSDVLPLVGKKCYRVFHKQDRPCENCPVVQTLATGKAAFAAVPKIGADGQVVGWLDLYTFPLLDLASGRTEGVIEYVRDITERKRWEEELQRANEQLKFMVQISEDRNQQMTMLNEMNECIQACQGSEDAYNAIVHFGPKLFSGCGGALYVLGKTKNLLELAATWEKLLPLEPVFLPDDCWALRRGRVHLVDDPHSGLLCHHVSSPLPVGSLCVPLMAQGEAMGILHLRRNNRDDSAPLESIAPFAITAAESLALALANLKLRETLRRQAIRDDLTGLFNRRFIEETFERELHRVSRMGAPLGLAMLDLDHFKKFNQDLGRHAGDVLLRAVGNLILNRIREEDIACRYDGEEFLLIMPGASLEITVERVENLRQSVRHLHELDPSQSLNPITISAGVAIFPQNGASGKELILAADAALYQAKREGCDRVVVAERSRGDGI